MSMPSQAIPCLRYRNARSAIESLCSVIGFEKHLVVDGPNDEIVHSQLVLGGGMIMVGSATPSEFGNLLRQPDEIDGRETQCAYIVVEDADAVYARSKDAGWRIVMEIRDEEYGGRGFTCADLEGHLWSIGTYNPWKDA